MNSIEQFKDIHKNERCFIFGCGPSINDIEDKYLKLLEKEIVIGVNSSYLIRQKFDIKFKYYGTSNKVVWNTKDILELDTNYFLIGEPAVQYISNKDHYNQIKKCNIFILNYLTNMINRDGKWLSYNLNSGVQHAYSVVPEIAIPISYYIGCKEIYLLGVDANSSTNGVHFYNQTPPKNAPSQPENYWNAINKEHRIISSFFKESDRKIYNATPGGKLEEYERKSLSEIFNV